MKDTAITFACVTVYLVLFVLVLSCVTRRGTLEWTFDGTHHVLLLGNTR